MEENELETELNEIKNIEKDLHKMKSEINAYDIAYKTLELRNQETAKQNRRFFILFLISLLTNIFLVYYISTTTVVETSQEGIYNFQDSEGNMVSSDLSLEEMKELVELNGENNN